jgi:hypothetical protein
MVLGPRASVVHLYYLESEAKRTAWLCHQFWKDCTAVHAGARPSTVTTVRVGPDTHRRRRAAAAGPGESVTRICHRASDAPVLVISAVPARGRPGRLSQSQCHGPGPGQAHTFKFMMAKTSSRRLARVRVPGIQARASRLDSDAGVPGPGRCFRIAGQTTRSPRLEFGPDIITIRADCGPHFIQVEPKSRFILQFERVTCSLSSLRHRLSGCPAPSPSPRFT